jgi:hypothetical protein
MRSKEPMDWSAVVTALAVLGIMTFLFLHWACVPHGC